MVGPVLSFYSCLTAPMSHYEYYHIWSCKVLIEFHGSAQSEFCFKLVPIIFYFKMCASRFANNHHCSSIFPISVNCCLDSLVIEDLLRYVGSSYGMKIKMLNNPQSEYTYIDKFQPLLGLAIMMI